MEVRYIVFTSEETRQAIASFVAKQTHAEVEQITGIEITGDNEAPTVTVHAAGEPVILSASDLVSVLLFYCWQKRVPVSQRSQKRVERSPGGLSLVLTTDQVENGTPIMNADRITYRDSVTMRELAKTKRKLDHAEACLEQTEQKLVEATARADAAEKASAEFEKAAAKLSSISQMPGLRGLIGRRLTSV